MKAYPHLVRKLFFEPLVVLPSVYQTFERALLSAMGLPHAEAAPQPEAAASKWRQNYRSRMVERYGDVAVIHIDGVIDKRMSDFDLDCYGGVDLDDVDAAISAIGMDKGISRVVFDIHSPGGSAAGVAETAERIRMLGEYKSRGGYGKETHARVDVLCASAAQWLASQCDIISAAPSATLGSVGVYLAILDETGWLEQNGLRIQMVKAGKYKAMGAGWNPLSDEEVGMLQARVDALWSAFKGAVASKRDVPASAMEGQTFQAEDAKKHRLADRVESGSLDEYVAGLLA